MDGAAAAISASSCQIAAEAELLASSFEARVERTQVFRGATNCRGDGFAPKPPAPAFSAALRNAGETSSSPFNNYSAQHRHTRVHPGVPQDAGAGGFSIPGSPLRSERPGRPLHHNSTIAQLNIAALGSTPVFRRTQGLGALASQILRCAPKGRGDLFITIQQSHSSTSPHSCPPRRSQGRRGPGLVIPGFPLRS